MEVLEKQVKLVKFSLDLPYLSSNNNIKLSEDLSTSSSWRRDEGNSFVLVFNTFYKVLVVGAGHIIDYHSQLELKCLFDMVEDDAAKIATMKQDVNVTLHEFLQEKMGSFYSLLNYPKQVILDGFSIQSEVNREATSIKRIMNSPKFEEMTAEQKEIAKLSQSFAVNFEGKRN